MPGLTPALQYSRRIYVRLAPGQTHIFRFMLEAYDNLAYCSVVDRKVCILKVVCAPGQTAELAAALAQMRQSLDFDLQDAPLGDLPQL